MLALGGLRAGFARGAGSRFKEIVEISCAEGFRKNETEVVSGNRKYAVVDSPASDHPPFVTPSPTKLSYER